MPPVQTQNDSRFLTPSERERLQMLAPKFDVLFDQVDDETYRLIAVGENGGREVILPAAMAYRRLLAEICARAAPWVHFQLGMSCRDSLLRDQSEARLSRVAELYGRDRDAERLRATGDCANV